MTELLLTPVEAVSLRWLVQIVLLSLGLTLASRLAFRGDSQSLRSLGVAAMWLLLSVPIVLLVWQPRYQIGVVNPPALPELSGIPSLFVIAWLLVATIGCIGLLVRVIQSSIQLAGLRSFSDSACDSINQRLCERLEIRPPRMVVGERCCASSIGRATLVVPADFATWPLSARQSVIAHELVHLKRRDDRFIVGLQFLARCYLFCPWLYTLYSRFMVALEEACDERAAELVGSRQGYLEGLAEAALREGGTDYDRTDLHKAQSLDAIANEPVASLIDAGKKHSFMQRLARLIGRQRFFEVQSGALVAGMAIGLLALAAFTTFEFVPAQQRYLFTTINVASSRAVEGAQPEIARPAVRSVARFPARANQQKERYSPSVIYPGHALIDGIEGDVLVEYSIAADGSTVRPRVLESTHPDYLNRAAVRAVEQTVYYTDHNRGISGVTTARENLRAGELLAVHGNRTNKAQKLFLFRLNAAY